MKKSCLIQLRVIKSMINDSDHSCYPVGHQSPPEKKIHP